MRFPIYWTLLAGLLGCTSDDKSSSADSGADTAPVSDTTQATMVMLNPTDGSGVDGVSIESATGLNETTDTEGAARFSLEPGGTFQFSLSHDGAMDHLIFGPTGSEDFTYSVFLSTEAMLESANALLGTAQAHGTGIVAVYAHDDAFQPVVGATASIGSGHDDSWVWLTNGAPLTFGEPTFGDTVPETGNGIVVFPNTNPGQTSVTLAPPDGVTCSAFPGGGQMPNAPVLMNHITVVTFRCQN